MDTTLVEGHRRDTGNLSLQFAVQYFLMDKHEWRPDLYYKEAMVFTLLLSSLSRENNQ